MALRGRKFAPTKADRHRVMRLRAAGWTLERIARVVGVDAKTLDKHFAMEIEHGADVKNDELLEYAERGAKKGNAANIKWLKEQYNAARAARQLEDRGGIPMDDPAPPKLGKKELQQEAAAKISGKFAPPSGPAKLH